MDLKKEDVESYLRKNPEFIRNWFLKEVPTDQRNEWMSDANLLSAPVRPMDSVSDTMSSVADEDETEAGTNGSGSSTARQEQQHPRRNSMTSNMFRDVVQGKRPMKTSSRRKNKDELSAMSERERFMELIRDVASEMDVNVLCHKILLNVCFLTQSDRGSLFLLRGAKENRYLVSKLFDVTATSSIMDSLHTEENQIRVPLGMGIAGKVAQTKEAINIKDAYQVGRSSFFKSIRLLGSFNNILCFVRGQFLLVF